MLKLDQTKINTNRARIIKKHSYMRPYHYIGPDYPNTISIVVQSRDSSPIERSNFTCALELLGGESDTVQVIRDAHWACGWIKTLRVSLDDKEATDKAIAILLSLEEYPILDDDHLSDLEYNEACEYADSGKEYLASQIIESLDLDDSLSSHFDMLSLCYELQLSYQLDNGHGSDLDGSDLERVYDTFKTCVRDNRIEKNQVTELIAAIFDIELK